jgi:hypothetical protein
MGKGENLYTKEFINYYIKLGVDKIFIYDDNDPNTEKFSDVISKSEIKYVKIYESLHNLLDSLTSCYNENKNDFDWFIMVDMDEFLYIVNDNLKNYLLNKRFEKCDFIKINWVIAKDNNLLHYDNRSLFERFKGPYIKTPIIKSIIRGKIENLTYSVHSPKYSPLRNVACNNIGKTINNYKSKLTSDINIDKAYIIHFRYKSTEEFIKRYKKGYNWVKDKKYLASYLKSKILDYFNYNQVTKNKVEYIERELHINLTKYNITIK